MTSKQASLAVLTQAMQIEREGMAFYGEAATRALSGRARDLFTSLVGDETTHLNILQAEYHALKASGSWLGAQEALPQIAGALSLFPKGPRAVDEAAAAAGDLDALQFAMGIEQKGYDLYAKAAKDTADPDGRALLGHLAKMESRHYKALQDAYGFLTHPGHWFDDEERPIFEG